MNDIEQKYFAILNDGALILVEITPDRVEDMLSNYNGDEDMYVACVLSEEFGFRINNVEWSVIYPHKTVCAGKTFRPPRTPEDPQPIFIVQHHKYDRYEDGCGPDGIEGKFDTREEAIQYLKDYKYEDEYGEVCSAEVNEGRGIAEYYDGWYDHMLIINKI